MAPLWLSVFCAFPRTETDDEKALNKPTRRRAGAVFQRYDTNVDGEHIPHQTWYAPCSMPHAGASNPKVRLSSIWAFIRQSDEDQGEFIPQYRSVPPCDNSLAVDLTAWNP